MTWKSTASPNPRDCIGNFINNDWLPSASIHSWQRWSSTNESIWYDGQSFHKCIYKQQRLYFVNLLWIFSGTIIANAITVGSLSYDHIWKDFLGMIGLILKQICLFENNLVTINHLMPFSLIALSFVRRFCPPTSSSMEHQKSWILGENIARLELIKICPRNINMCIEVARIMKRAPLSSDRVLVVVWFGKSIDQFINVVHSTRNTEISRGGWYVKCVMRGLI